MKTLNDWLKENDQRVAAFPSEAALKELGTALKIIREIAERCGWADAEYAAEQIINEQ